MSESLDTDSPPLPPPSKTALVLSGGGAKGAYEVGVLRALSRGKSVSTHFQPLEADIFTGTSVGAYNASFLISSGGAHLSEATKRLEEVWCSQVADTMTSCGNGVFRIRGFTELTDPACWMQPVSTAGKLLRDAAFFARFGMVRSAAFIASDESMEERLLDSVDMTALFSPEPLRELVANTVDLDALGRSDKKLVIAATNWREGTLQLFTRRQIAHTIGDQAIRASAAIPGIFRPVMIGSIPFADGGLVMNTPLKPAIQAGADIFHVVYLDPFVSDIPLRKIPSTLETVYRMYAIMLANSFNGDFMQALVINQQLALGRRLGVVDRETALRASATVRAALPQVYERFRKGESCRPLIVHKYRPANDLGGGAGLIDFSQGNVEHLIELGYGDTVLHDCERSGCILWEPAEVGALDRHNDPW